MDSLIPSAHGSGGGSRGPGAEARFPGACDKKLLRQKKTDSSRGTTEQQRHNTSHPALRTSGLRTCPVHRRMRVPTERYEGSLGIVVSISLAITRTVRHTNDAAISLVLPRTPSNNASKCCLTPRPFPHRRQTQANVVDISSAKSPSPTTSTRQRPTLDHGAVSYAARSNSTSEPSPPIPHLWTLFLSVCFSPSKRPHGGTVLPTAKPMSRGLTGLP